MNAAPTSDLSHIHDEHLVFRIGNEEYGFEILGVQEIRSFEAPTRMVGAPHSVLGIINLRQIIVPIVDLRRHMGYPAVEPTPMTVVIVVNVKGKVIGMVADSVADVVRVEKSQLHPAPVLEDGHRHPFVQAIASLKMGGDDGAKSQDRMIMLLDMGAITEPFMNVEQF